MAAIDRIEVLAVAPDVPTFRYTDHEPPVTTTTTVVRVIDADGAEGAGAYDSDTFGEPDRAPLERLRYVVPRLIGRDADDRAGIAATLTEGGTLPWPPTVASAVEIALWDLAARRADVPLARVPRRRGPRARPRLRLGRAVRRHRPPTSTRSSGGRDVGFTAAKIHAWGDPARDAALLERLHAAFPDLVLMHDAEGRYDRGGARRVAEAGAAIGLRWLEAPLPDLDLEGYRSLRGLGVPMFPAGDAVWDPRLLREIMRDPPWDAVRFDVSFAGGVGAGLALGEVARRPRPADRADRVRPHADPGREPARACSRSAGPTFVELPVPAEPWEHGAPDHDPRRRATDSSRCRTVPASGSRSTGTAMRAAAVASLP